MMHAGRNQQGVTLFVALIFLLIMTLFAVSSINLSTVNLRIVGNMQALKYMEAAAHDAIEQVLSDPDNFKTPASAPSSITSTIAGTAYTVSFATPDCIHSKTASGYSAVVQNIIPEDNTWEVVATVDDPLTAQAENIVFHQGVEMRMLQGSCP